MHTQTRYSGLSVLNHWVAAIAVFVMLTLGLVAGEASSDTVEHAVIEVHIALGFFVLLIVLWRVAWRLYEGFRPNPQADVLERHVGGWVHRLLLIALVTMVVTGPLYLFTEGEGINVFGWFTVYLPLQGMAFLHEPAEEVHKLTGEYLLPALITLHFLGAVRHYLFDGRRAG